MLYHIITTPECNLCCSYCGEKAFCEPATKDSPEFESVPSKIQYSMQDLKAFFMRDKDPEGIYLTFYGGEPLMNIEAIKQAMDFFKKESIVKGFMLQTNGTLLNKLSPEYVNRFRTILVSIDGDEKLTDSHRGSGTYKKVISNLKTITSQGYKGELIARMTVEEPTDFFEDIMELIEPKTSEGFRFTSIHWQLDANMWHDYTKRNFATWAKQYNKDISRLADFWIENLKKGKVLRLYPFMGVLDSILNGTKYYLRCGSGVGNFTILPNGKISACPIMSGIKEHYLGNIRTANLEKLPFKLTVDEPCTSCDDLELCGGRCLYSNLYPPWPKKGVEEVCETVKHLLREMERISPQVQALIDAGKIKKKDLGFVKYNGAEIIP